MNGLGVAVTGGAFVGKDGEKLALLHGDGRGVCVDNVGRRGEEGRVVADGVLASLVKVGDELVQLCIGVVPGEPESFSVVRVVGTTAGIVMLLLALVQDGNAVGNHGVGDDVACLSDILVLGWKARVVVVLAEGSKQRDVLTSAFGLVNLLGEVGYAAAGALESID